MTDEKLKVESISLIGGTGNLGPGLALRWALAGYEVFIGSRTEEKAKKIAEELNQEPGVKKITGLENSEAVAKSEICVLTVNQTAHDIALESLKESLQGKILVDATARLSFPDLTPPPPPSSARIAQNILGPGVKVVAAFQNVAASALRKNPSQVMDSDALICADDVEAAEKIIFLARDVGMRAFYSGDLDKAIVVEGLTSILVAMNKHYKSHAGTLKLSGFPNSNS